MHTSARRCAPYNAAMLPYSTAPASHPIDSHMLTPPPYPAHLIRESRLRDGTAVTLRPIRPDDAEREARFVHELSDESRYYRFMDHVRDLSPSVLAHFTQIDYHDHMALVATTLDAGEILQIGVARYVVDADSPLHAEFAIAIADVWQNRGVGARLMTHLITAAQARGLALLFSDVLSGNRKMLSLMNKLDFIMTHDEANTSVIHAELALNIPLK